MLSFVLFLVPGLVLNKVNPVVLVLLFLPFIIITPALSFAIFIFEEWPPKQLYTIVLTAAKEDVFEFISGMWGIAILLFAYYALFFLSLVKSCKTKIYFQYKTRIVLILSLLASFLVAGMYSSVQKNEFSFFSGDTVQIYFEETPYGVYRSIYKAWKRREKVTDYTKKQFDLKITDRDSQLNKREVYVLVLGESSRYDNWQLNGYKKKTNPRLINENNIFSFDSVFSSSFTTLRTIPYMLSPLSITDSTDKIQTTPTLVDYYNEAGFKTVWLSTQHNQFNKIGFISVRADLFETVNCYHQNCYDGELIEKLQSVINENPENLFVVLHTNGSHYPYQNRYPDEFAGFVPDMKKNQHVIFTARNRQKLINSYNNSILYTDYFLSEVIRTLRQSNTFSAMIYCSDHGENLFDNSNIGFGRGFKNLSPQLYHVPLIAWFSDEYLLYNPGIENVIGNNLKKKTATEFLFYSVLDISGFKLDSNNYSKSIISEKFRSYEIMILSEQQTPVPFSQVFK
ncbi:MAG: phosphoethanolamine transferase [Bacteroidales bacterium]|nr:phosphoethanolamine transferase [Bacteroidales bacterium]MBN2819825.1 phosphoethanolamine transferase [Bacteroidales bacterium]